jgi:hypothetical protein
VRRSNIESWTSLIARCCVCGLLAAGCGDDAPADAGTSCPGDASVGMGCPDADTGGGSGGSAGGRAGSGGSGGSSTGAGSGGSGGSDQPDEDGGADPQTDSGMPTDGPSTDGSQLSACAEDEDCTEDRVCYLPGAQEAIGYCTGSCSGDEDCAALGAQYTCNAMGNGGGNGGMGVCRIECEGEDDTSCPDMMMCVETSQGSFRCAYTEEPEEPPAQDMQLWEPCEANGDCVEGLICYGTFEGGGGQGPGGGGGQNIGGYCTQPCENTDECTEPEPSGNISPTCGSSGGCRFECTEDTTCPDGMECMELQGNVGRCLFPTE